MSTQLGNRTIRPHLTRLVTALIALLAGIATLAGGTPATAGGWAIASLDAIPDPSPGATAEIGFTIMQHGVTPVDLDDVGIEILFDDGASEFFPAASDGAIGHYVATVTFPDRDGAYGWQVQMGWFGPQDLGTLTIDAEPSGLIGVLGSISLWALPLLAHAIIVVVGRSVVGPRLQRRRRVAVH